LRAFLTARKAKWAAILDHFTGLTPADFAGLTDFQIDQLYLHARDKDGAIKTPSKLPDTPALTEEQHVTRYRLIANAANRENPGAFSEETIAAKVAEIRAYHARKRDACPPPQ
jgi:predicted transcriptional regulator